MEVRGTESDRTMSAYRTSDGRWRYQARIVVNGKLERPSGSAPKINNTKAAAIGAERAHIARLLHPEATTTTARKDHVPTFAEWAAEYMAHGITRQSQSEIDGKRQKLKRVLLPMLGGKRIDEIGRLDLDRVRTALRDEERAPSTINNHLSVIGAILGYAVECEKIKAAPKLGLLKLGDQPFEFYTDDELTALLASARGDVMTTCAYLLGADAGLRAGEIRALHRENIGNGKIVVMFSDYEGKLKAPKGGRSRTVDMNDRLELAIRAALRVHAGPRVLVRLAHDDADGRARRWNGMPWTKESMTHAMPHKGWHALRHTFCSRLAAKGVPATEIKELAGHESIKTTQRYMHVQRERLASAVRLLDDEYMRAQAENGNAAPAATGAASMAQ